MKAIDLRGTGRWFEIEKITDPAINRNELRQYHNSKNELTCTVNNILLRNDKIVIPQSLRDMAVSIAHEGHQGMARTKAMIRSKVWFPGINERVEQTIHKCLACQSAYSKPGPFELLRMSDLPPGAWQNLSMDFCGPLPTGEYLMVIMDEYSRYPNVEIVKSVSANTVIPVLDKVLSTFGCCKVIKTDNGSPFNSHAFAKFAEHSGFKHRRIQQTADETCLYCSSWTQILEAGNLQVPSAVSSHTTPIHWVHAIPTNVRTRATHTTPTDRPKQSIYIRSSSSHERRAGKIHAETLRRHSFEYPTKQHRSRWHCPCETWH